MSLLSRHELLGEQSQLFQKDDVVGGVTIETVNIGKMWQEISTMFENCQAGIYRVITDGLIRVLLPERLTGLVTGILTGEKDSQTLLADIDDALEEPAIPQGTVLVKFVPTDGADTTAHGKGKVDLYGIAKSINELLIGRFVIFSQQTAQANLKELSDSEIMLVRYGAKNFIITTDLNLRLVLTSRHPFIMDVLQNSGYGEIDLSQEPESVIPAGTNLTQLVPSPLEGFTQHYLIYLITDSNDKALVNRIIVMTQDQADSTLQSYS